VDPDACLNELRRFARMVLAAPARQTTALERDMAEHVQALDEWLVKGGFPPHAWDHPEVER
jgi:hypothetical protein